MVFPVVFSIDSAFKRRENALIQFGDFKNHLMAIFVASRDWLTPEQKDFQVELRKELIETYELLRISLLTGVARQQTWRMNFSKKYPAFQFTFRTLENSVFKWVKCPV
ncbi:MAG: hypothetical protein O2887_15670 [Bacteroidetes bacterium]|nr:hypothetical protein [Bacteroidota bacterium]